MRLIKIFQGLVQAASLYAIVGCAQNPRNALPDGTSSHSFARSQYLTNDEDKQQSIRGVVTTAMFHQPHSDVALTMKQTISLRFQGQTDANGNVDFLYDPEIVENPADNATIVTAANGESPLSASAIRVHTTVEKEKIHDNLGDGKRIYGWRYVVTSIANGSDDANDEDHTGVSMYAYTVWADGQANYHPIKDVRSGRDYAYLWKTDLPDHRPNP